MDTRRLYIVHTLMKLIPITRFFNIKNIMLKWAGANIENGVRVSSSAQFFLTGSLCIGNRTWIGHDVLIIGGDASVKIGVGCDVGPRAMFVSGTHKIEMSGSKIAGEGYSLPIEIGNGCWIGAGATILGGTTIGERSIIAAGAVVRGNFPANCLIGGVPARLLRNLPFNSNIVEYE